MYKVIIVEDEPYIAKTIKQMIESLHPEFEVTALFFDGESALQQVNEINPDVIFTDIRMPIMDGLSFIAKLRGMESEYITILLSGYQEFGYAKQALKLGVYDYLLKPLNGDALLTLLQDVHKVLSTRNMNQQLNYVRMLMKQSTEENLPPVSPQLFPHKNYVYMLCCAGSFTTFTSLWHTPSKDYWLRNELDISQFSTWELNVSSWVVKGAQDNERLLVVGFSNISEDEVIAKLSFIHQQLSQQDTFPLTSIIRKAGTNIANIYTLLHITTIRLKKAVRFGNSSLILEDAPKSKLAVETPDHMNTHFNYSDKQLELYIQSEQNAELKIKLAKLFEFCKSNHYEQLKLERLLKQITGLFYKHTLGISENRKLEMDLEINELISNHISYDDLLKSYMLIIDELFQLRKNPTQMNDTNPALIQEVDHYIALNYAQSINLQSISTYFKINPQYLSRLYKSHKGMSPLQYLVELRITKTKELLAVNPPLVLKDIAEVVGFNDPFYLSKVFKTVTGVSPSEYRLSFI